MNHHKLKLLFIYLCIGYLKKNVKAFKLKEIYVILFLKELNVLSKNNKL